MIVCGLIAGLALIWPDPFWRMLRFFEDGVWVTISITVIYLCVYPGCGAFRGAGARLAQRHLAQPDGGLRGDHPGHSLTGTVAVHLFCLPTVLEYLGKALISLVPAWASIGRA